MEESLRDKDLSHMLDAYNKAIDFNIISSITDEKGTIVYANKKFCDISKYGKEELIGKNHRIVNSGHHPPQYFRDMWKLISKGKPWYGEIKNKAKDGSYYWVDTVIIPVIKGNEVLYLSLRTLINERKELEKGREDYINSLEEMVFLVSHKLRAPLVSILGLMQLNTDNFTKEEMQKTINYYKTSVKDLEQYTRELNDYLQNLKRENNLDV